MHSTDHNDLDLIPFRRYMVLMPTDYGRCLCGGHYQPRVVEVRFSVGGSVTVLTGIQQGACDTCGSRIYKSGVLARIEAAMKGESRDPSLTER
jgi:YgiT-type zinc finger domain-containing protein